MIEGGESRPRIATEGIVVDRQRVPYLQLASEEINQETRSPRYLIVQPENPDLDAHGAPLAEEHERVLIQGQWAESIPQEVWPLWRREEQLTREFKPESTE